MCNRNRVFKALGCVHEGDTDTREQVKVEGKIMQLESDKTSDGIKDTE
jgi:hypothetical protein